MLASALSVLEITAAVIVALLAVVGIVTLAVGAWGFLAGLVSGSRPSGVNSPAGGPPKRFGQPGYIGHRVVFVPPNPPPPAEEASPPAAAATAAWPSCSASAALLEELRDEATQRQSSGAPEPLSGGAV